MPNTRCKWYGIDGRPIRGGCSANNCRFIHPGQRGWDSLGSSKVHVRCMYFDSNGKRIHEGCMTRNCRFTHPNDPEWESAVKSRLQPQRRSISVSSAPRSTQLSPAQSSRLPNNSTDACQTPTEAMRPSHIPFDSSISRPLKLSTTNIASEIGADLTHTSSSPHLVSTSLRNSQPIAWQSSEVPTSALSESTDDHSRRMWKRRITLLTQAHNLVQKLSEIGADLERQTALHSNNSAIEALAGANLETLKDSARQAQMNLEVKLNSIISQLVEDDFWPLPTPKQPVTSVSRPQPQSSANLAELGCLLDTLETQLNKVTEMAKSYQGQVSVVRSQEEGALSASKRRRLSTKRSSRESVIFQEILGRLDCLQGKAIELEADKLSDGRLLEEVDERVDGWLLEKSVIRPLQADSLKDAVQKLDTDLDVLCNELAELDTADLTSQIGTLRLDTGNLKQTMESLASDHLSLQARQASLDQQTRKIMAELPELQALSQGLKCSVTTDCDKVAVEVKDVVQGHIDAEWAKLIGSIQSYHEEMKKNVFALLEPTVLKTETLYTYVSSRIVTGQHN